MIKFQVGDILSFYPRNGTIEFYRPISENKEGKEKEKHIRYILKRASFVKNDSSFQEFLAWLSSVFEIQFKEVKVSSCNLAYKITFVPE